MELDGQIVGLDRFQGVQAHGVVQTSKATAFARDQGESRTQVPATEVQEENSGAPRQLSRVFSAVQSVFRPR
ncbi:MAG: hypothetical protein AAF085_15785, partial [Planctomycetota bacterium]